MKNKNSKFKKILSWEMSHESLVTLFVVFLGAMTFYNIKSSYRSIRRSLQNNTIPEDSVFDTAITVFINKINIQDLVLTTELIILAIFLIVLVVIYILILFATVKFLKSYSSNTFRFSKKSVSYLKLLGTSLAVYTLMLIASKYVFLKVGVWSNYIEMVRNFDVSSYSDLVLVFSFFTLVFANLVSRSMELQEEVDATV